MLRPVSEVYQAPSDHHVNDVPNGARNEWWGYGVGYEVDADDQDVPQGGNTAIFNIEPLGMTEPVYVTKPDYGARFTVNVLSGAGVLLKTTLNSNATELAPLQPGGQVIIESGRAYTYVNIDAEANLILRDVAIPAFRTGDEVALASLQKSNSGFKEKDGGTTYFQGPDGYAPTKDGSPSRIAVPTAFLVLAEQAKIGQLQARSKSPGFYGTVGYIAAAQPQRVA